MNLFKNVYTNPLTGWLPELNLLGGRGGGAQSTLSDVPFHVLANIKGVLAEWLRRLFIVDTVKRQ